MMTYSPPTAELHVIGAAQRYMVRPAAGLQYVEVPRSIAEDPAKLEAFCTEHTEKARKAAAAKGKE